MIGWDIRIGSPIDRLVSGMTNEHPTYEEQPFDEMTYNC